MPVKTGEVTEEAAAEGSPAAAWELVRMPQHLDVLVALQS